ncbi:hypothetical protein L4174_006415 [Photobacterium sp. CCB-ST2H9]|uniref:flagellar basal body rod C-terminal domain-containing protein n=1 Tax=Photobacterium sp. CCB-ST2H9 TaxID=2912855 RepID=UPI002003FB5A|nr:flagellar basal body rod C-terminal domain-containing protein [Photobacterium sp. CCB-ST2H9]UTM58469.1 hypothetical protein L4174_006415 [Photobacterium sp. CCB-ST2H9]
MEKLSAIDLMSLSMQIEKQKMETATYNLSIINQSFGDRLSVQRAQKVDVANLPSIDEVISGVRSKEIQVNSQDDGNVVGRVVSYEGGKPVIQYRSDIKIEAQMIHLNDATRAYEASLRLFNMNKEMSSKILQIGSKR